MLGQLNNSRNVKKTQEAIARLREVPEDQLQPRYLENLLEIRRKALRTGNFRVYDAFTKLVKREATRTITG